MEAKQIVAAQVAIIIVAAIFLCAGATAQERAPAAELPRPPVDVPGITPQMLSRTTVPGAPGKLAIANRVTYEPGARRRKHYHTSQVFFYILEGTMAVQDDGKEPVSLKPGDFLLIKPGTVHAHWNASTTEKLVFTEFILVDDNALRQRAPGTDVAVMRLARLVADGAFGEKSVGRVWMRAEVVPRPHVAWVGAGGGGNRLDVRRHEDDMDGRAFADGGLAGQGEIREQLLGGAGHDVGLPQPFDGRQSDGGQDGHDGEHHEQLQQRERGGVTQMTPGTPLKK